MRAFLRKKDLNGYLKTLLSVVMHSDPSKYSDWHPQPALIHLITEDLVTKEGMYLMSSYLFAILTSVAHRVPRMKYDKLSYYITARSTCNVQT